MPIARKLKTCCDCKQQRYIFSKGRCENCDKIHRWKRSHKESKQRGKTPAGRWGRQSNKPTGMGKTARQLLIQRLDRKFSEFIRLRDTGPAGVGRCISSGRLVRYETCDAGHFIGRANMAVRWDERNVNAQHRQDNRFREGNRIGYLAGLRKKYGEGIAEELEIKSKTAKGPDSLQMRAMLQDYTKRVEEMRRGLCN